ncbi:MAG: transcription elongation GreA/GreB family factor, partial [Candidatus Azotimanducaceae bacterium]
APLGKQLLGRYLGDDISLNLASTQQNYVIAQLL